MLYEEQPLTEEEEYLKSLEIEEQEELIDIDTKYIEEEEKYFEWLISQKE